ncbi:hypothetical protein BOA8489_01229 [Boseongicola aestuarii]|uniref:Uncharacterized protein n=1 Tax=Boseongicola aestuarii TaxID=1470561 RepID=A0A238IXL8_9RHOB|nr:hypothetical protein BOA8489_01229 [Boseongicola aestuarii]
MQQSLDSVVVDGLLRTLELCVTLDVGRLSSMAHHIEMDRACKC